MRVCPKWSGVAPCADRQKTALSGLFSVESKVGGRRLSSSLCREVVKLDILLFPVDFVPFTRDYECSGGRSVSYLRSVAASHVGSFHSADPVRTLVGGRRISSSIDRGLEVLGFPSLRPVLVVETRGSVLSNDPDAIFEDLHSTAQASSDPVRLCSVHKIRCSCDQLKKKKKKNRWVPLRAI